jgi:hypothetical protein
MVKTRLHFLVALMTLLLGVGAAFLFHERNKPRQLKHDSLVESGHRPRQELPDAEWEEPFFKALDQRLKQVKLPSLRTVDLSEGDLEVRFWYDASPDIINGFVFRRSGDQWTAVGIKQMSEREGSMVTQESLRMPKSGWDVAWKRLVSAGILTLPDGSSQSGCHSGVLDGVGYVVETNVNEVYRTYRYGNPQFAECAEAKQVLSIEAIIADEFALSPNSRAVS